jgi:hypothetical protein
VVGLAARELTEREAVLDRARLLGRARLLDQAEKISGGRHAISELDAALDRGPGGLVRLGQDLRGREFYTTRDMLLEAGNLERVKVLTRAPSRGAAGERAGERPWISRPAAHPPGLGEQNQNSKPVATEKDLRKVRTTETYV